MNLKELIQAISTPCHIDKDKAMDREIEFCTIDGGGMSLLSVYEGDDGKIYIDIGTSEDCDEHTALVLGSVS